MKSITIKQIADQLHVSTSTVSRALSDNHQISLGTKKIVREYATKKGYKVNRFAKGLREGKTNTIGVVVCSIDNAFMIQIINGIYDACKDLGYQFLIMQSRGSFEEEKQGVNMLLNSQIDGLLISPSFNSTDLTYLSDIQENGLPIVLFDRISQQVKTHQVAVDNFNGAFLAAKYLMDKDIKRVLAICGQNDVLLGRERLNGFLAAIQKQNFEAENCLIEYFDQANTLQLQDQLEHILRKTFIEGRKAEAIFTTTDSFTAIVLKTLNKLKLNIPLVGFCNSDLADILLGKPTTVFQPAYELGNLACKQLLSLIKSNNKQAFETIYLPTKLVERS